MLVCRCTDVGFVIMFLFAEEFFFFLMQFYIWPLRPVNRDFATLSSPVNASVSQTHTSKPCITLVVHDSALLSNQETGPRFSGLPVAGTNEGTRQRAPRRPEHRHPARQGGPEVLWQREKVRRRLRGEAILFGVSGSWTNAQQNWNTCTDR